MLHLRSLLVAVILLSSCLDLAAARRGGLERRGDSSSVPSPSATKLPSISPTSSPSDTVSPVETGSQTRASNVVNATPSANSSTTTSTASGLSTAVSVSATPTAVPTNINDANSSSLVFNATLTPDALPIAPQITPGFSVAGVLLIMTGTVYALVGMRNKRVHIFLSAAYLASLAVTVLIIYVMNPPVSNGIQGAYVVAVTLTGLILGGGALLLKEMTEGLGCLFGGFCLAMWLLVLKPGGLLAATGPIVIFIVCFTVVGWAISFSKYTRPYGLIVLMSFGGATVLVLGIDCFSRAGLKEFWAYIWNLNQNLFPLGATTYPLTRGIKVEIAAIFIIFLVGIGSQTKLWRIIKKRRERRALDRRDDQRHLSREEEKVGRRIESVTARQRAYWEAIYGNKDSAPSADSGIGSIRNHDEGRTSPATSTRHSSDGPIELEEISIPFAMTRAAPGMAPKRQPSFVVRVVADDDDQNLESPRDAAQSGLDPNRLSHRSSRNSRTSCADDNETVNAGTEEGKELGLSGHNSKTGSKRTSGTPEVIPLPFRVIEGEGDDSSSVATAGDDEKLGRLSKRFSHGSDLWRSLSQRSHMRRDRLSQALSISTEKLVKSSIEEDRRSSLAATIDDLSDDENARGLPDESPERSPVGEELNLGSVGRSVLDEDKHEQEPRASAPIEALGSSPTSASDPDQQEAGARNAGSRPGSIEKNRTDGEAISKTATPPTVAELQPVALTKDALPPAMPKVVSSYRTNEWAKHLSNADSPDAEDLHMVLDPMQVDSKVQEAPASVNIQELQQTPETAQVLPAPKRISQFSNPTSPQQISRTNLYQPPQSVGTQPSGSSYTNAAVIRSSSQQSLQRPLPQQLHTARLYRNSSTPNIGQTLVESPIEDMPQGLLPNNTLLDQRDAIIRNKSSLGYHTPPPASTVVSPFASSTWLSGGQGSRPDDDSISLSARRSMLRQSSMMASSIPAPQSAVFDSHQPRRQSSTPVNSAAKDFQLAQWRATMQQDIQAKAKPKQSLEKSRTTLLQERMVAERQREVEQSMKGMRDSALDERMRQGDMMEAHREALRRMQREANKNL